MLDFEKMIKNGVKAHKIDFFTLNFCNDVRLESSETIYLQPKFIRHERTY